MKVTFIFHSSFAVELAGCVLVFDYYGEGRLPDFPEGKKTYFLNSHRHKDHFRWQILGLKEQYPKAEYLLSSDIRLRPDERREWTHRVEAGQEMELGELCIHTLRSTDTGVAFCVEAEGRSIYHAGDLNWWHWHGEKPERNHQMEKDYKEAIDSLKGKRFDAAFVPLDPRLGRAYFWGMKYFLENTEAGAVFPMHCWGDYDVCARLRNQPELQGLLGCFHDIMHPGQEWTLC